MQKLIQSLLSPRAVAILLVAVLVLAIYFVGDMSHVERIYLHIAAAVVVAASLVIALVQRLGAAKSANALESALRAQGQAQLGGTRPDQRASIEELKGQFDESLELLRKSKMGRGALHSIPWYVLVGPPGSGKSTLLRQSGLSFPYMTKGRSAIRGLGGTKNCDWWFADRGILLDTAGRFMTEAEDREEWMAFLRMIKRGRKHRPINGAIVAVGIPEVLEGSEKELQATAENVRDRIDELTRELGAVFPIYLVFTKCDRLRGFVETFDTLNKDQRKQVWGFTFPFTRGKDFVVADQFGKEFDELYRSLCVRRIDLLASDHFKKRKAQVYAFPMQFLRMKERLQSFLGQLQAENPYQEASPIRGVYFTSGTQEGTTIDRILKVVRPADLEHDVPEDSRRCYFVDDLFNSVVFDDAALASPSAKSAQRTKWLRLGTAVALGIASLAVVVMDWDKRSAFGAEVKNVTDTIGDVGDLGRWKTSLDAQLGMLEKPNEHIRHNHVLEPLERCYLRSLAGYASKRIGAHITARVQDANKALEAGTAARFAVIQDADRELELLKKGVDAFIAKDEAGARGLWKTVMGDGAMEERHFARLVKIGELGTETQVAAAGLASGRVQLDKYLQAQKQADLQDGRSLSLEQLFPRAWARLSRSVKFSDCNVRATEGWSKACLALTVNGPLWSRVYADASASHVEGLLEDLKVDVDAATQLPGQRSKQPLDTLPDGRWSEFVGEQRNRLLSQARQRLDENWVNLLRGLTNAAITGTEHAAEGDKFGARRLGDMPVLVWCYKVARTVLSDGVPLGAEEQKRLEESLKAAKAGFSVEERWSPSGKLQPEAKLADVVARARQINGWLETQERQAHDNRTAWDLPNLESPLVDLEVALLRAVANREWAACRLAIEAAARTDLQPAWQKLTKLYPFNRDAVQHASGLELKSALEAMSRIAVAVAGLEPKAQFELNPDFAKNMQAAEALQKLLYDGEVRDLPAIVTRVRLQSGGGIVGATLESEERRTSPFSDENWTLGKPEFLWLGGELSDGSRLKVASISSGVAALPVGVLTDDKLSVGMWNLKRLCDLGEYDYEKKEKEVTSKLSLIGREDRLLLRVRFDRPEIGNIFSRDWPDATYVLSSRIWAKQ